MKHLSILSLVVIVLFVSVVWVAASELSTPLDNDVAVYHTQQALTELSAEGIVTITDVAMDKSSIIQFELAEISAYGFVTVVDENNRSCSFALQELSARGYHIRC